MRPLLSVILLLCTIIATAQTPSGNISTDTTLANQLYQKALSLDKKDTTKFDLLQQAIALCAPHDVPFKQFELKATLTYWYAYHLDKRCVTLGEQMIAVADSIFEDKKPIALGKLYYALQYYYNYQRDFKKSEENGQQALNLLPISDDDYFNTYYLLIGLSIATNQIPKLNELVNELDTLLKENTLSKKYTYPIYYGKMWQGQTYRNDSKTILYGKQLINHIEKYPSINIVLKSQILATIGTAYGRLGLEQEGVKWLEKGINLVDSKRENVGSYYYRIGLVYVQAKKYKKALKNGKKALHHYEQEKSKYIFQVVTLLTSLGQWYFEAKDYKNAEIYILKAYEYESPFLFYLDIIYANILNKKGEYEKALRKNQRALTLLAPSFKPTNLLENPSKFTKYVSSSMTGGLISKANILYNKGLSENSKNLLELSLQTCKLALEIHNQWNQQVRGFEQSRLTSNIYMNHSFRMLQTVYYQLYQLDPIKYRLDELFIISEQCKALVLLESLTPSPLPSKLVKEEESLINAIRNYEQKLTFKTDIDSTTYYQNKLFDTAQKLDALYIKIQKDYPKSESFYHTKYATPSNIQQNLSSKALWVEYSYNYLKQTMLIYAITKQDVEVIQIPFEEELLNDVKELQKLLRSKFLMQEKNRKKFIQISHQLYQKLIQPIEEVFVGKQQLIIVPEEEMFHIPFEVLLDTPNDKPFQDLNYLIKKCEINYHYSATTHKSLQLKPNIKNNALLAFAPIFGENSSSINDNDYTRSFLKDSLYMGISNKQFVPLPNSKQEVETIATILNQPENTTILTGKLATKNNFETALNNQAYQFIHIATHGLANLDNPKLSALACYHENEQEEQDIFLFSNEIQTYDIRADLVVLSSCESGMGQLIQGEGLIALNRSFIYAGAKNILFSLWKVHDEYTRDLMINFYKAYTSEQNYAKALRSAKLKMISNPQTAVPRFWAAFLLLGE